ncbi:MAG: cysteine desulfurase [Myxococcales bacterium]|nr:cysteine desulfurase [Myxococcales bacterium]
MTVPMSPIYLDYNATTPLLPEVVAAMLPYLSEHFGNPSSSHIYGSRTKSAVAHAREQVARLLGCSADEIFFTSGGTEANNLSICGVAEAWRDRQATSGHIVTSVIEHPATSNPCSWLQHRGMRVSRTPVDSTGRITIESLKQSIDSSTTLVTLMHSNNETGVLQPISEAAALAHEVGAVMHTDAAQSIGKIPVHVDNLGVDLLSVAGHKLYAPKGVGALYVRRGTPILPFLRGAGHERGLRPGTENVASIVGLGEACEQARLHLTDTEPRLLRLRNRLWNRLNAVIPGLALNGHPDLRLPNTLNLRFPMVSGLSLLAATPEVAASTGSACHDGAETASSVILAMGIPQEQAIGSVRFTVGRMTTEEQIDQAAEALSRSWSRLVS